MPLCAMRAHMCILCVRIFQVITVPFRPVALFRALIESALLLNLRSQSRVTKPASSSQDVRCFLRLARQLTSMPSAL